MNLFGDSFICTRWKKKGELVSSQEKGRGCLLGRFAISRDRTNRSLSLCTGYEK
jgi:hypothetical protein